MKRVLACVLSLVLVVGLLPVPAYAAGKGLATGSLPAVGASADGEANVTFKDKNLYDAVVAQLRAQNLAFEPDDANRTARLTASQNAAVKRLDLCGQYGRQIADVSGLEAFTELTWLNLAHNSVSSSAMFKNMSKLVHLDLYDNQVRDLSGFEGLSSLKELNLGDNNIGRDTPLAGLDKLAGLTSLTWLDLSRDSTPEITKSLSKLTSLTHLNLLGNKIREVEGLENLTELKTLVLNHNSISGVGALAKCKNLEELHLANNYLYRKSLSGADFKDSTGIDVLFDEEGELAFTKLRKLDIWSGSAPAHLGKLYELCKAGSLELGYSYQNVPGFDTSNLPHTDSRGVEYVAYDDFITYCDDESRPGGIRDDYNAIRNAHRFANEVGCEVRSTVGEGPDAAAGKTYHIFNLYSWEDHVSYSSIDWQGANFVVHDDRIDYSVGRTVPLMYVYPSPPGTTPDKLVRKQEVAIENPVMTGSLNRATETLAGLCPEVTTKLADMGYDRYYIMAYNANKKQFGASDDQWDGFIVDATGALEKPGSIQWDFEAVTKFDITPIPAEKSYIRNGHFTFLPLDNKTQASGGDRGLRIYHAANLEISNVTHVVGTEASNYDNDELSGAYGGFFDVRWSADVDMHDCTAWARRATRSTYGISLQYNVNVTLTNVNNSNTWDQMLDIGGRRWGLTGTNYNKHVVFDRCTLNRIDAHKDFCDLTVRDCRLGAGGMPLNGRGSLTIENTDVYADSFFALRADYGLVWDGDARITNCTHHCLHTYSFSQAHALLSLGSLDTDANGTPLTYGFENRHPNLYIENFTLDESLYTGGAGYDNSMYCIVSNPDNSLQRQPADFWPETVQIDGFNIVGFEESLGFAPHVRMPSTLRGYAMDNARAGKYTISNFKVNGQPVSANMDEGEELLPNGPVDQSSSNAVFMRDFTLDKLAGNDIVAEFRNTDLSVPRLWFEGSGGKGNADIDPYFIEHHGDTSLAYFSNDEMRCKVGSLEEKYGEEAATKFYLNFVRGPNSGDLLHYESVKLLDTNAEHRDNWSAWMKLDETSHERICMNGPVHREAANHTWNSGAVTKKPTVGEKGVRTYTCEVCGATKTAGIAKLVDLSKAKVTLAATAYAYNGKVRNNPTVKKVVLGKKTLSAKTDYTVKNVTKSPKAVGTYQVTVQGKGAYGGEATATFKINPANASSLRLKGGNKLLTATWKKPKGAVSGYKLKYSMKKSLAGAKTLTVKGANVKKATIRKLKPKKTYYVSISTYAKASGKTYSSSWSKPKPVRVR